MRAVHLFPGFVYTCVQRPRSEPILCARGCVLLGLTQTSFSFVSRARYVPSNALASASIVPRPVLWAYGYVGPLMARFTPMGNLPAWYAEIPVYIGANPSARGKGLEASNERLKPLGWPAWAEGTTGKKVWEKLKAMVEV